MLKVEPVFVTRLIPAAGLSLFGVVLFRTAWMSDDAYISLRTVANLVAGAGLRWNPDERVQSYTHPLWLFVTSAGYAVTREPYFTVLLLSIACSLVAVGLLLFRLADSPWRAAVAAASLILSKAFIDFSSSGLENPLTHLLLVVAFVAMWNGDTPRRQLVGCLAAGLASVNRLDIAVLIWPFVAWQARRLAVTRPFAFAAALGGPIACWTVFSLIYYGFPFPNTAYAKLATGIPRAERYQQGLEYFRDSLAVDPLTLVVIAGGISVALFAPRARAAAVGIVLYLLYVLSIGGDFMSGRFFAAPMLVGISILAKFAPLGRPLVGALTTGVIVALGMAAPRPTITSGSRYSVTNIPPHGIADERGVYYQQTGLMRAIGAWTPPRITLMVKYSFAVERGRRAVTSDFVGVQGYLAGNTINIIDLLALGDPLLARLPADRPWRVGHYPRRMPDGYFDSVNQQKNLVADPDLAVYYEQIRILTRGPIWTRERLKTILAMNTGRFDDRLKAFLARRAATPAAAATASPAPSLFRPSRTGA